MTNPPNIDAIIAELSEAQRRWIRGARPEPGLGNALTTYPPSSTCKVLYQLGLWLCCGMLTPLGLVVRSALIGEVGRDG